MQVEDLSALYKQSLEAGYHVVVVCSLSRFANPSHLPITVMRHISSGLIVADVFQVKIGRWVVDFDQRGVRKSSRCPKLETGSTLREESSRQLTLRNCAKRLSTYVYYLFPRHTIHVSVPFLI